jgi:hypothetical protein
MRILFAFLIAIVGVGCNEDVAAHYRTYADLQRAGAGPQSWMPRWMPSTATDIYDWHSLDTNATLISFHLRDASPSLLRECEPATQPKNPGRGPWWPTDRDFASMQHFKCEEQTVFADGHISVSNAGAALDRRTNRVYYWR